jgi:probable rRNA maturation factor
MTAINLTLDFISENDKWGNLNFPLQKDGLAVCSMALQKLNWPKSAGVFYEVAVLLSDDEQLHRLNREFRGKDRTTNVLSFPSYQLVDGDYSGLGLGAEFYLGDVAISYTTLYNESLEQGKDFRSHYLHLLLHGFLHLIGFDHIEEHDADKMEAFEVEVLTCFGIKNPYQ